MRNHRRASGPHEYPPPLRPLDIINRQCAEHDGEWLVRIRIHPLDYPELKRDIEGIAQPVDLIKLFIEGHAAATTTHQPAIGGVPIVKDPTCLEGPVCDWHTMDFEATLAQINRVLGGPA